MKSNQKLSILFWVKNAKATKDGRAPLYARITIDGLDEEISLSRKVHHAFWDTAEKKDIEPGAEAKKTNQKIEQAKVDLERHFTVLQSQYQIITPLMLKNVYKGYPVDFNPLLPREVNVAPRDVTILEAFNEFIAIFTKKVAKGKRSEGTLRHWKTTKGKVASFLKAKYDLEDYAVKDIKYIFAELFYNYLTLEVAEPLAENTAKTHIKKTKQILKGCAKAELISKNPIADFSCGGDDPEVIPLELFEVEQIYLKRFSINRLEQVKDAFICQCFTGFAYQDFYGLTRDNIIKVGVNGERWLVKHRGKTEVPEMVPILPIVEEILDKYENHPVCLKRGTLLPINSNTRYNGYLKEIADLCGINRDLKTHLARHTFADIMLNNGAPLEDVQRMLGHKSIRTTQRYAKVRKSRIAANMHKVKTALFTRMGKLRKVA